MNLPQLPEETMIQITHQPGGICLSWIRRGGGAMRLLSSFFTIFFALLFLGLLAGAVAAGIIEGNVPFLIIGGAIGLFGLAVCIAKLCHLLAKTKPEMICLSPGRLAYDAGSSLIWKTVQFRTGFEGGVQPPKESAFAAFSKRLTFSVSLAECPEILWDAGKCNGLHLRLGKRRVCLGSILPDWDQEWLEWTMGHWQTGLLIFPSPDEPQVQSLDALLE